MNLPPIWVAPSDTACSATKIGCCQALLSSSIIAFFVLLPSWCFPCILCILVFIPIPTPDHPTTMSPANCPPCWHAQHILPHSRLNITLYALLTQHSCKLSAGLTSSQTSPYIIQCLRLIMSITVSFVSRFHSCCCLLSQIYRLWFSFLIPLCSPLFQSINILIFFSDGISYTFISLPLPPLLFCFVCDKLGQSVKG